MASALNGTGITFSDGSTQSVGTSGNFQFNSGYGSTATAYGCRAWVNFNGTGTVAIRASGNVSSITDNGTGNYQVNFSTAMPDANYSAVAICGGTALNDSTTWASRAQANAWDISSASYVNISCSSQGIVGSYAQAWRDAPYMCVSVFR